jgi:hypothetical protein
MSDWSKNRPITKHERWRFALVVTVLALIAAFCAGCIHFANTRTPTEQHNMDVIIEQGCMGEIDGQAFITGGKGSGVIVGRHHVLTAMHMAECQLGQLEYLNINTGDGREHRAEVEFTLPDRDVMRLRTADDLTDKYFVPIEIGPKPDIGATVCEASATPVWTYRCGVAEPIAFGGRNGDIRVDFKVEHGNSGSGLYDAQGRLVGIIVMLRVCEFDDVCQGFASSLYDYPWLAVAD